MIQHVGFTGTRFGMTPEQLGAFQMLLRRLDIETFHHGDCIGSDRQAHDCLAARPGVTIHIWPPDDSRLRAYCDGEAVIHDPAPYLDRNHSIVRSTQVLIATPFSAEERRSGTWATVRFARQLGRTIYILMPSGLWVIENERVEEPQLDLANSPKASTAAAS